MAAGLITVVVLLAGPSSIWQLIRQSSLPLLIAAAGVAFVREAFRGLRLLLLLPPRQSGLTRISAVAVAAQAAALFVPARVGELALPYFLERHCSWRFSAGLGTLVACRSLDLAALAIWSSIALILVAPSNPIVWVAVLVLVLPTVLVVPTARLLDRCGARIVAWRGRRWRRIARSIRRIRTSLETAASRRGRFSAAVVASFLGWACVWLYTWLLVRAMGYDWGLDLVLAGSCGAAVANLVPVSLVANVGTLEAGWTATFTGLGIELKDAAASGVAAHFWGLVFSGALGLVAWFLLTIRSDARSSPPA